jgi:hypothetical protein
MTGTEILNTIHTIYEQDIAFPDITSEDYAIRLTYLNQAIKTWESELFNGFLWNELFVTSVLPFNTTTINNFLFPEKLYVGNTKYDYVLPHNAVEKINNNTNENIYYVTGGSNNKIINIYPVLSSGNYTISYYKEATLFNSGNIGNHIEMANPNFTIQYVLAQLYASDGDQALSRQSMDMATQYLTQMKTGFDALPFGDYSNIEDDNIGFGV